MDMTLSTLMGVSDEIRAMAQPGVHTKVYVPQGDADFTYAMPLLRCLAQDDDAQSPADVDPLIMPSWVASVTCTIADNLPEHDYIAFCESLAKLLPKTANAGAMWNSLRSVFVQKIVRGSIKSLAPLAGKYQIFGGDNQRYANLVSASAKATEGAGVALSEALGIPASMLDDDIALGGRIYNLINGVRSDARDIRDVLLLPFRLTVFGAGFLSGSDRRARQMILDYDWSTFLAAQYIADRHESNAGLNYLQFGDWFIRAARICLYFFPAEDTAFAL